MKLRRVTLHALCYLHAHVLALTLQKPWTYHKHYITWKWISNIIMFNIHTWHKNEPRWTPLKHHIMTYIHICILGTNTSKIISSSIFTHNIHRNLGTTPKMGKSNQHTKKNVHMHAHTSYVDMCKKWKQAKKNNSKSISAAETRSIPLHMNPTKSEIEKKFTNEMICRKYHNSSFVTNYHTSHQNYNDFSHVAYPKSFPYKLESLSYSQTQEKSS